ncbi:MAG: SUMF1/EgtB/PvdO family nonheme iron enzyme [Phycisphaerales bacterium]|nr:SUMF1/EgtB/PvdO family nonheme iron enzyme [Phycisphaerales bacterium]
MNRLTLAMVFLVAGFSVQAAKAQAPDYDFQWATIGDLGNPAFPGPSPYGPPYAEGRGSVGYTYRISRLEVTTGQWLEFANTINALPDAPSFFAEPYLWGAEIDPLYNGPGHQWRLRNVPSAGMLPVAGISWRDAGRYCNWLHNGKQASLGALVTGAYDTATWGDDGPLFTDDPTHLPGAQFWIPTLDEWMKSARYDPNRFGQGQGGWWMYAGMSDVPLISGAPGEGGGRPPRVSTPSSTLSPNGISLWAHTPTSCPPTGSGM